MPRLFVPGFGAPASLYAAALPLGWTIVEPPSFRRGVSFEGRLRLLADAIGRSDRPVTLAGHSMGAALAVLAALERPSNVERLVLVAPAGLPLTKPVAESLRDFVRQVAARLYPTGPALRAAGDALHAPRAAWRLMQVVRRLDLTAELDALRRRGVPCEVIACTTDTLTPTAHCRAIAALVGGGYRELDAAGGHMWMLSDPGSFASALTRRR
jgi:pimeloyl-ACP methyl ester carboxylesterase